MKILEGIQATPRENIIDPCWNAPGGARVREKRSFGKKFAIYLGKLGMFLIGGIDAPQRCESGNCDRGSRVGGVRRIIYVVAATLS